MRVLVIQHHSNSGMGHLIAPAAARGVEWGFVFPLERSDPIPEATDGYDGLVIFGGVPHANDDERYPYLKQICALIEEFHNEQKPVLGICLGSQLVARTFRGKVYKAEQSEIGFYGLELTQDGEKDPLLRGRVPSPVHLIEFHYDTFELPRGATQLLTGAAYAPVQAFRMGRTTYAFQPHFEATAEQFREWLVNAKNWVDREHPHLPGVAEDQLARHAEGARDFAHKVGGAWFDLVAARRKV